jgi:predicted phosphodiesterase
MSIFVTGDIHGEIDIRRLSMEKFPEQKLLTKEDYLIILGDFGLVWNDSKQEKYWRNWLTNKTFTTLFVDGNHENFERLAQYPVEYWKDGRIQKITESVFHLMRGEVFTLNKKKFLVMGGAESTDKNSRQTGISWWDEEMPNFIEYENTMDNLDDFGWSVDYVLTHTAGTNIVKKIEVEYSKNQLTEFFDLLDSRLVFKRWFFGHHHVDKWIDSQHCCVYQNIIRLSEK